MPMALLQPVPLPDDRPPSPVRLAPPARRTSLPVRLARAMVDVLGPRTVSLVRHGPRDRRRIALTFDDGPGARTAEYLAALGRCRTRATFFVIGKAAAAHPQAVRAIAAAGHELAAHGYSERAFPSLDGDELSYELAHTAALLPAPAGGRRPLVRPPRGVLDLSSVARCAALGYTTVLWSLDSDDCRTAAPEGVAEAVQPDRVRPGDIVRLHDSQPWTVAALPLVIAQIGRAHV